MPSPRIPISAILVLAFAASMTLFVATPASAARVMFTNATPIVMSAGPPAPASPSPSTITVGGLRGPISGVSVRIDRFSHMYPALVDILLVAPSGESVMVMSDACGFGNGSGGVAEGIANATWTFGQGPPILPVVPGPMPEPSSPCDQYTYLPTNYGPPENMLAPAPAGPYGSSFAAFNNENPNGVWSLFVQGSDEFWGGQIAGGWALTIETGPADASVPGTGTQGIASPYPLNRTVADGDTVITDLNVSLDGIFHQNPADLDLLLVGPTGKSVVLMSDACGTYDVNAYGWEWDDEAPAGMMPEGGAIDLCGSRTWRPTDYQPGEPWPAPAPIGPHGTSLAAFDLTDPNGEWRLFVQDDAVGGIGFFTSRFTLDMQVRPKAVVAFTEDSVVLAEGATRTLTLTRSGAAPLGAAAVAVTTAPGTATSGADYTPLSSVVTFAPGQTDATVPIDALPDSVDEGEETYTVSVGSPTGDARLAGSTSTTVTIPGTTTSPPQTTIDSGPKGRTPSHRARFRFSSSVAGSTFECRLDGHRWKPCTSPEQLKRLKVGKHRFLVRAINTAGIVDPTPATRRWTVTKT